MTGRSYRHSPECITGYRLACWGDRYANSPNTSNSYTCPQCAAHRISRQLQGLYQGDYVTLCFTFDPRTKLMRRARRHAQPLGLYRFERCRQLLAVGTKSAIPDGAELPTEKAIQFAIEQGIDLVVEGWSRNQHFPTVTERKTGAEIYNWPSFLTRKQRNEICNLLGYRAGRRNPQHAGIPVEHLFREAVDAYAVGRLHPGWKCPIPITDGTEEWDDGTGDLESWDWD